MTPSDITTLATQNGYDPKMLHAIIQVESGQHGFDPATGKIIIQFEPTWFKREYTHWAEDTKHVLWQSNKVGDQWAEWLAFNNAFAENPDAAMKSTSIGMMQVMGFHYAEIGFKTVGEMWDYAKVSEYNQVELALKWAKTVPKLDLSVKQNDFEKIAYYWNGQAFKKFNYDERLRAAFG